jgi:hypothetical protein
VAVNASLDPLDGVDVVAVKVVLVSAWVGCVDPFPEPDPPPQLVITKANKAIALEQINSSFRQRFGTITSIRMADETPPTPISHPAWLGRFRAMAPAPTPSACVVVIVNEVLPLPVTEDGEKTQAAPDGRPEQENVTVPVNPSKGESWIALGPVI